MDYTAIKNRIADFTPISMATIKNKIRKKQ